jgi:hypothetical protein
MFILIEGFDADKIFKAKIGHTPNKKCLGRKGRPPQKYFTSFSGSSKEVVWQTFIDKQIIDDCFSVEDICNLPETLVITQEAEKNISENGMTCKNCYEHNKYATSNQPDGTYICYKCRCGY